MTKDKGEMTPLMKQFWDIKSLHNDKILLFRMGDFYEMFYDDAIKAAPILGITLTQRNKKAEDQTPMCGVPYHSIAGPINKLLAAGLKIAVCDQVEDAKLAKGLVRRAVTRILTPGMVYDSDTLEATKPHYIAALDENSMSFVDATTGEAFYFKSEDKNEKIKILHVLPIAEVVLDDKADVKNLLPENFDKLISKHTLKTETIRDIPYSAQLLQNYVLSLSDENFKKTLRPFVEKNFEHRLQLSSDVIRHLEIFETYKGQVEGSFFSAVNKTKTSGGARLLRNWILFPLRNKNTIGDRQKLISALRDDLYLIKKTREVLAGLGDIERRLIKISQPQTNARDLVQLADALEAGLKAYSMTHAIVKENLNTELILEIVTEIRQTINDQAPLTVKSGHMINKGVSVELDEYIELSTSAHLHIEKLEEKEKLATGINSLKIRYNNVFGYYIEITHLHKDKVPKHYQRKQTLANAERFCTDELIQLEQKVLSAQTKRNDLEYFVYETLKNKVLLHASYFLGLASVCNQIDVYVSLAWLSLEESYVLPQFNQDNQLKLTGSRHVVIEQFNRGKFVANDIDLQKSDCYLITGPNMAGKSTLMRQAALTVILAQMGSYVPAASATLPIYDAIYTRIGASDQLSEGLSTFMVEMTETAQMLNQATGQSLLILDEVGRGTSTFDGLSLAQSILEYIISEIKPHVFFASHYHELTALEKKHENIKNVHMKIHEQNGEIQFLHVLARGPAGKSYGVQVAKLAGLPSKITTRAAELLVDFENQKLKDQTKPAQKNATQQMSLFDGQSLLDPKKTALLEELKKISISQTSPLQALNKLAQWQDELN